MSTSELPHHASPTPWQRAAWPLAVGISPLLFAQGKWVRRQVPKLPPAPGPLEGHEPGARPLRILGVGDSTVVGVGVDDASYGLIPQFARAVGEKLGRGAYWRCVGESGATSKDILARFVPAVLEQPADIVVVSLGGQRCERSQTAGSDHRAI